MRVYFNGKTYAINRINRFEAFQQAINQSQLKSSFRSVERMLKLCQSLLKEVHPSDVDFYQNEIKFAKKFKSYQEVIEELKAIAIDIAQHICANAERLASR